MLTTIYAENLFQHLLKHKNLVRFHLLLYRSTSSLEVEIYLCVRHKFAVGNTFNIEIILKLTSKINKQWEG